MLMGGYVSGQDPDLDLAVTLWPKLVEFIKQSPGERAQLAESANQVSAIVGR
jgi:flagellum-specific ATP synthase